MACIVSGKYVQNLNFLDWKFFYLISVCDSESETGDTDNEGEHNLEDPEKTETPFRSTEVIASGFVKYSHQNFPIVVEKFKDPVTEYEKLLVVVSLPSGSKNVKAELGDDGITVTIKYAWPKTMYDIQDLFKKQLTSKQFHLYHPMVLCYKNGLENVRKKIDMAPESSIKVNLPMKVQTAVDSWKHWGVIRDDGTQVFLAELSGYVKEYIKKSADESVIFEN